MDKEKENKNVCEKCNKIFFSKYTLKNHVESKICERKISNLCLSVKCSSLRCSYETLNRSDLQKHLKTCKYIEIDLIVDKLKEEHKKELEILNKEIGEYKKEIELLDKEHKKEIEILLSNKGVILDRSKKSYLNV